MTQETQGFSSEKLESASRFLANLDPHWQQLVATVGPCQLAARPEREPYEALVRSIAYQQLHGKAAAAILGRFLALYPGSRFPSPQQLLNTDPAQQKACGFSSRKVDTIRGLATATEQGVVPTREQALVLSNEELIARLTTLQGIGRWTVQMLLIFNLERADILPVDDFGVREGYRRLRVQPSAPTPRELKALGESWQPWRSVASWYLWQVPKDWRQT